MSKSRKQATGEIHERLYSKIPAFQCRPGCTDCCGPVPFSKWEWSRIKNKRLAMGIKCPYARDGKCEIYEQRPLICRLYGAVEDVRLTCPYGCKPEVKLTKAEADKIMREYFRIMEK